MNKTVILGDSFFVRNNNIRSWTAQVYAGTGAEFLSESGSSNSHIWLRAREALMLSSPGDKFIIGWSDKSRLWTRYPLGDRRTQKKLKEVYVKHFYNLELVKIRDRSQQQDLVALAQSQGVHLLWMWSFPWSYRNPQRGIWADPQQGQSVEEHVYTDYAPTQIRPALFHYSMLELEGSTTNERIEAMSNDTRPNHIADTGVHDLIAGQVLKWHLDPQPGYICLDMVK